MKLFNQVVAEADVPNRNGRVYRKPVLQKVLKNFHEEGHAEKRTFVGTFGMPSSPVISLSAVSHVVTDLRLEGHNLVADVEILDTPSGKSLREMMNLNKCRFRTCGLGSCDDNGVVSDNFKLTSIAAVWRDEA